MTSLTTFLTAVKQRLAKATPGPWRAEVTPNGPCGQMCYADAVLIPVKEPTSKPGEYVRVETSAIWCDKRILNSDKEWRGNLSLIASAPTDLAKLLAIVELQQSTISKVNHALANAQEWYVYDHTDDPLLDRGQQVENWMERAFEHIQDGLAEAERIASGQT